MTFYVRRRTCISPCFITRPGDVDMTFRPKYITFDCYGTLTYYPMHQAAFDIYDGPSCNRSDERVHQEFQRLPLRRAMGDWKPYLDVLHSSLERACKRHKMAFCDEHAKRIYDAVPSWGPHADVPHALTRIAKKIPLVILSNAMNEQIDSNVEKLKAPFHKVYTAQNARAYKPRLAAFEYMLDQLGCAPAGRPARLGQSALRHLLGARPRHREQGVREPRA